MDKQTLRKTSAVYEVIFTSMIWHLAVVRVLVGFGLYVVLSFEILVLLSTLALILKCHSCRPRPWGAQQRGPGGPQPTQNFGWVSHNAFGPTNNWPVCSIILRKISRIGATKRQILRLKCTNSLSVGAPPQTPLWER